MVYIRLAVGLKLEKGGLSMSDAIPKAILDYLQRVAEQVEPIFKMFGWEYDNEPTTADGLLEMLIGLYQALSASQEADCIESGRFLMAKSDGGVGVKVYLNISSLGKASKRSLMFPLINS
jgi:hypothetical protein